MNASQTNNDQYLGSTIYVGDLSSQTLESDLFRIFSSIGEISKIKLKKRQEPLSSFAFVTFNSENDANRAVKEYNNYRLNKKSIRVSHCVDSKTKKMDANIIVKNLPANFTNENLFDSFSMFGDIISAKIATYADGKPKNYGFVQYEKKKSAKLAIKHCDGGQLDDKIIQVEIFDKEKRKRQEAVEVGSVDIPFTNCFIKNFPDNMTQVKLEEMLNRFGEVTSMHFPYKENTDKTIGYAFANFATHESCCKAIEELHGKQIFPVEDFNGLINPEPFYIQKAQKKEEREEQLKKTFEQLSVEGQNMKRNLYVTNIPSFVEKPDIIDVFSEFGSILSVILGNDGVCDTKKYACICYKSANEAFIAVEKGNEIYIDGNKLHVTYFKNKNERSKDKLMSSASGTGTVPYIYNSPINMSLKPTLRYDILNTLSPRKQSTIAYPKLYELIRKNAYSYKKDFECLGVETVDGFAEELFRILCEKSKSEIEQMESYNVVLCDNINRVIEDAKQKETN